MKYVIMYMNPKFRDCVFLRRPDNDYPSSNSVFRWPCTPSEGTLFNTVQEAEENVDSYLIWCGYTTPNERSRVIDYFRIISYDEAIVYELMGQ